MKLLFDTQVVLWELYLPRKLLPEVKRLLDRDIERLVSIATIWEVAIKRAKGQLPFVPEHFIADLDQGAYRLLPISAAHAWRVGALSGRHRDPFDRLLIAQALEEDVIMVSSDSEMVGYGVEIIPA